MENRVVALSVLEDLIHWPLAPRDGSSAPNYSNFYLTGKLSDGRDPSHPDSDDDEDEDEFCFVAANATGGQHLEPRAKRQARYRAVLRLPLLCQKLGPRWVSSEVVPYLLRCLEEEDPQLSFAVGLALLGLVLPTSLPRHATGPGGKKEAGTAAADPASAIPAPAFRSHLTLEAVRPVLDMLPAARDGCTRHFAAQVVLPHLLFGVSLERAVGHGVGGWEASYVPQWVLAEDVAQRGADAASNEAGESAADGAIAGDADAVADEDDGGNCGRLRHPQHAFERKRSSAVDASLSAADPLRLKENFSFFTDEECTSLCLTQRRDPVLARCGWRDANARAMTERRTRLAFMARVRACGGLTLLRGAPLALFGASYAAERAGGGLSPSSDYFTLNVQAHALVKDITSWMEALAPSAGTRRSGTTASLLLLRDYLCEETPTGEDSVATSNSRGAGDTASAAGTAWMSRREALRQRWRTGLQLMEGLLASGHPGTVAAAVESVAMLLNAISCVLSGTDVAALALPPAARVTASSPATSSSNGNDGAGSFVVVAKPRAPLRTEAELQAFQYYTTRRHVAFCLVAAHAPRRALPTLADAHRLVRSLLTQVQASLHQLLIQAGLLVRVPVTIGPGGGSVGPGKTPRAPRCHPLQFGPGPREVRAGPLSAWDVCFSAHGLAPALGEAGGSGDSPAGSGPDDVAHLLLAADTTAAAAGAGSCATPLVAPEGLTQRGAILYAAANVSSLFRQPRPVRTAVLRALPLALDTNALLSGTTAAAAGVDNAKQDEALLTLEVVCRLLLEAVTPASLLPALLSDMADTSPDGSTKEAAVPSSPARRGSYFTPSAVGETPASLDFGVAEAALSSIHRLLAEVSVALPTLVAKAYAPHDPMAVAESSLALAPSPCSAPQPTAASSAAWSDADDAVAHRVRDVLRPLFTLVQATVCAMAVYPAWKARWLLARRLGGILAAYLHLVVRVGEAGQAAAERANAEQAAAAKGKSVTLAPWCVSALPALTPLAYYQVAKLGTALWGPGDASGAASAAATIASAPTTVSPSSLCSLWIEDEESEVRSVAAPCAAAVLDVVAQAAVQIAACEAKHRGTRRRRPLRRHDSASHADKVPHSPPPLGYPETYAQDLVASLAPLLQPLVPFAEAVVTACGTALQDRQPPVRCAAASALSSVSRTLSALCTVSAASSAAAAGSSTPSSAGLPAPVGEAAWKRHLANATGALLSLMSDSNSAVQLTLVAELADLLVTASRTAPTAVTSNSGDATAPSSPPSAAQVRHSALLSCLESLAKHEVWRFRERYALLLCEMITKFLTPRHLAGDTATTATATTAGSEDVAGWSHTNPLFRLARHELLPMLVAVLFDKVKAVRDAALDAADVMCQRLHAADVSADHFVNDVLWPLIRTSPRAHETYLSRSALVRVAVRLRVDKASILLPLLDQLAHDTVLNVRLVVAKTIHEVLVQSSGRGGMSSPTTVPAGASTAQLPASQRSPASPLSLSAASGGEEGRMRNGTGPSTHRLDGSDGAGGGEGGPALPPVVFTDEEKDGVVLTLLRQLLEDPSADVRDEAARALKVCF